MHVFQQSLICLNDKSSVKYNNHVVKRFIVPLFLSSVFFCNHCYCDASCCRRRHHCWRWCCCDYICCCCWCSRCCHCVSDATVDATVVVFVITTNVVVVVSAAVVTIAVSVAYAAAGDALFGVLTIDLYSIVYVLFFSCNYSETGG